MAKAPGPRCHVVATLLAVGAALIASPVSPARAVAKPSPSTTRIASGPETRLLVAATRAAALREANRFRVTIGHPVCPAGTRTPMPVVQCLVVLGDTTVAYLVGMAPDGTLAAHPTFPVVSSSDLRAAVRAAEPDSADVDCGKRPFQVLPVGSTTRCTVKTVNGSTSRFVRLIDANGRLRVETTSP